MIPLPTGLIADGTVKFIVYGLALTGAAIGGASLMADHKNAEIAKLAKSYQEEKASTAEKALERLISAQRRGDFLQNQLATQEAALQAASQEKDHAIRRLTVGRPCLDSAAVRVLNQPAGLKPSTVPEAAGEPAGAHAAFATDTDVGLWIGICQRGYETCRGRLQAVADFYPEDASE